MEFQILDLNPESTRTPFDDNEPTSAYVWVPKFADVVNAVADNEGAANFLNGM